MDLAGWRAGKNSLTPDRLERRMEYLNKKEEEIKDEKQLRGKI